MELFALEHKRLWRTKRVWICVLLCFVYCVIYGSVLSYQWFVFGNVGEDTTSPYKNNFDGYSAIQSYKAQADKYGDVLTDETFQQMVKDFQTMEPPQQLQSMYDWHTIASILDNLYPELNDMESQTYQPLIHYVDTEKLTDFYGKRQEFLENNLKVNQQNYLMTDEDVETLREMNSKIEEPYKYDWIQGWSHLLSTSLASLGSSMAPYLAIALAFIFSGEWHNSTAPLLHTTKHGWRKLAWVKVLSGLAFAVEFFILIAGGMVISQLIYTGTSGWDTPIQLIKLIAVAPWNMLQAELYELAFIFLGVIGYAGVVMLFSALVKNNVLSLVFSLALIEIPGLLGFYLPIWAQDASQFIPLVGSPTDIFRMNMFHIFGKGIWMPWMLITVPFVIGVVCLPFAIKGWARRERA